MADAVELIFRIRSENRAALDQLRSSVSGINQTLTEHLNLTRALVIRQTEQIRQNNELINSINKVVSSRKQEHEATATSITKAILYSEAIRATIGFVKELTIESAKYAARTEQLNVIMDQLARVNGLSRDAVRQQADAIKALGITTQESRSVVNQMIFAQLDLSKATDLARLSQNAAKIAGLSSSEALAGIINGIVEQRVQILRTYGIQVQFEQALIRGAAALHKTREELTDTERANIAFNEVLSKAPRIAGAYEVSLSTASGQMQSMRRYIDEAKNSLGEGFIPVLQRVVQLLTGATRDINENAEAYQNLAKHITSVGLAITAAKLVPGGPLVKGIAALAVGLGAEAFFNVDQIKQQQEFVTEAISKIQDRRVELQRDFQKGRIKDQGEYLKEDERLKDLQVQIEENFTEAIARIYKKRQEDAKKQVHKIDPISGEATGVFGDSQIPAKLDLGFGRSVTREGIQAVINRPTPEPGSIDKAGLQFPPNISAQFDAILGPFTSKAKEALKTAQSAMDKAKEELLSGAEKVEQQRKDSLARLAEDFKPFLSVINDTLSKVDQIKDPKERQRTLEQLNQARATYGGIVGRINRQFDYASDKAQRDEQVANLQRFKKESDAGAEIDISATRLQATESQRIARANRPFTPIGQEENVIKSDYQARINAAQQELFYAKQRAASDYDALQREAELKKDSKLLADAESAKRIADRKAEGQFIEESTKAETDRQIAVLELRRRQRQEVELEYKLARDVAALEGKLGSERGKDAVLRASRLAQAQLGPGNEQYGINLELAGRVQAAQIDYNITRQNIEQQREAAYEELAATGDKADFERKIADLRKNSVQNAYDLEKAILDARLDKELQIAEIRKQQDQELQSILGKLYEDLKSSGGFQKFVKDYVDSIKKQLFVNLGAEVFRGTLQSAGGIIPGQQKIDPVTGKPTGELTQLGRILHGTPLGIDPVKLAQAQQINALDRNTKALQDLSGVINGTNTGIATSRGGGISIPGLPSSGGILGTLSSLGGILTGNRGGGGGLVINDKWGGQNFLSSGSGGASVLGSSGAFGGFFASKFSSEGGTHQVFSPGQTGLAAALSLPQIIGGIRAGGTAGVLSATSGALGIAASIPGPQQPFVAGGAALLGLLSGLFGKDKFKEWQDRMDARLAQKVSMPDSINLTQDLAGNAVDYDFRGRMRSFQSGTNINVSVSTMDARSFMDNAHNIAEATRSAINLGHPLRSDIKDMVGS
jgi:hypothetical protein